MIVDFCAANRGAGGRGIILFSYVPRDRCRYHDRKFSSGEISEI